MTTEAVGAAEAANQVVEATAAATTEAQTPEGQTTPPAEKTLTQAEVDAIIEKRLARERRSWERKQAQQPAPIQPVTPPRVEDYADAPAYAEALAETKAQEIINKREAEKQAHALFDTHFDREETARDKYDDYDQVTRNEAVAITDVMGRTIMESDIGPDILYALGQDPKEAARIAKLSPLMQAAAIGKMEAKLASAPPVKRTSSAPAPISPVKPSAVTEKPLDLNSPDALKKLGTSGYIEAMRKAQIDKLMASRNR